MNLVMLLNFPFPMPALRAMYDSLTDQSLAAETPKFDAPFLSKALAELVDDKNIKRVVEEIQEDNTIKLINNLEKTIFISELNIDIITKKNVNNKGDIAAKNCNKLLKFNCIAIFDI